jgi:alpha-D-ribose 1-methylphosphonate 5-triphosphate synthase subunit PhnH
MSLDLPGFIDPVAEAQSCFRALLDAMGRPGQVRAAGTSLTAPAGMVPSMAAVVLTLLDADTPAWLDPAFAAARDWIGFHCGAPWETLRQAQFVIASTMPDLAALHPGTDETPESAASVILHVGALHRGRQFRLTGPGLRCPAILRVDGLPADFDEIWCSNHARFPLGVDMILCAGDQLACLPRSVSIEGL